MTDLSQTIAPKSDQMNSDDLISGSRTIKITRVSADQASKEQPILVYFEGDDGKPYKPCKSMRRVMVHVWGSDGSQYVGRSMTLFRDPTVTWGGMQVGGIRISHMSHMDTKVTMALTATKSSRKPFIVNPLIEEKKPDPSPIDIYGNEVRANLLSATLAEWWDETADRRAALNAPQDRLDKWQAAVNAKLRPGDAE